MADVAIVNRATVTAPKDYAVAAGGEIVLKAVRAVIDGSGATTAYVPVLQVLAPDGTVMWDGRPDGTVAAGGSADVSWFPGVKTTTVTVSPLTAGTWTRVAEPLISPTQAWEGILVQEPDVHYESGTWKMWYTGNGSAEAMGYATCTGDPTVPANWVKSVSNPVLGQGGSGVAGWVGGIHVHKLAGTYHCFYYDANGGGNLKRSTSVNGTTWTAPTTAIASGAVAGSHGWANSDVWYDGTSWWLFVEASLNAAGGEPWGCFLFKNTSISNDGGWVVQNGGNPLSTLQVSGYPSGYGQGLSIAEIDGVDTFQIGAAYVLWCHASNNLVSDIMHAYGVAPSFTTWTPASPFDLLHNGGPFEVTQAADPNVLQVSGKSYLFFTGNDASVNRGYINLATYAGTLAQFLNGSQGGGTFAQATSSGGSIAITNPTGPTVNLDVAASGVTAGIYGSGSQTARVTVGADGRVTSATVTPITVTPLTNPAAPDLIFTAAGDVIMGPS